MKNPELMAIRTRSPWKVKAQTYSEPCQTSKMDRFAKIVKG